MALGWKEVKKFDAKTLTKWDAVLGWVTDRMQGKAIMENGQPYLERFPLVEGDWFGTFVHRFVDSDPSGPGRGVLHDHPYLFSFTIALSGWYDELRFTKHRVIRKMPRSRFRYLFGHTFHRVVMGSKCTKPCYTLFVHGPKVKPWGFMSDIQLDLQGRVAAYFHHLVSGQESFMENRQKGVEFKVKL